MSAAVLELNGNAMTITGDPFDAEHSSATLRLESPAEREARRRALLEEAKAWRWMRKRYGIGVTARVPMVGYLCLDVDWLCNADRVGVETHRSMRARIVEHLLSAGHNVHAGGNYFGGSCEGRAVRSLAIDFLVYECADEAQALAPRRGTKKRIAMKRGGRV